MLVKVCGITRMEDARAAAAHGATAVGFVFWSGSPRCVEADAAAAIVATLPASVTPVGVFVNAPIETIVRTAERAGLGAVQLHGDERAAEARVLRWPILRSATLGNAAALRETWPDGTVLLLDADEPTRRGGTGQAVDWQQAATVARQGRVVLAGGLTPENVAEAVARVRPFGVDVSSGVEDAPGVKNMDKMARFLSQARRAFEEAVNR